MNNTPPYLRDYGLRQVVFLGAVASTALIFLFLFAQSISYHDVFKLSVIDEMVAYAEFFLFAYASYFGAAILVRHLKERLARYVPPSPAMSFFGSLFFCFSFFSFVYVGDVLTYREGDPFRSPPGSFFGIVLSALIFTGILTTIIGVLVALVSAVSSAFKLRKESSS